MPRLFFAKKGFLFSLFNISYILPTLNYERGLFTMTNFDNKQTQTEKPTFQEMLDRFISSGNRNSVPDIDIDIESTKSKKHNALVERLFNSTPYNINLDINKRTILR